MQPVKQLQRDADRLDHQRARSEAYAEMIIREQEGIIEAAEEGIAKLNSNLRALRVRLAPYTGSGAKAPDDVYEELKHRYEYKLQERSVLENAITIAEESISAAKLHHIPGEDTRG